MKLYRKRLSAENPLSTSQHLLIAAHAWTFICYCQEWKITPSVLNNIVVKKSKKEEKSEKKRYLANILLQKYQL